MPVALAGVGGAAVLPPALTVLSAQGHVQDPLFAPALVHLGAVRRGKGLRLRALSRPALNSPRAAGAARGDVWGADGRNSHLLDPGPQVGGALIQAGVLDEVALAGGFHRAAVVPVESVQVGNILMGFLAGVDRAAGVLFPGTALGGEDTRLRPWPSTEYFHRQLLLFESLIPQCSGSFGEILAVGGPSFGEV